MTHEEMLMRLDAKMKEIDERLKRLEEDESFLSILKTIKEDIYYRDYFKKEKEDKDG